MKHFVLGPRFGAIRTHALLAAWIGGTLIAAGQGTVFTYQGRLTEYGSPAQGQYELTCSLFGVNSGGSPLTAPITTNTVVTNGLFTVTLDFGANVFTGAERWLEIGVRPYGSGAFTTLWPRQQITPAPYAITASQWTGLLAGDVIGPQGATVVSRVGGQNATDIASGAIAANAATSANTANAIVKRDASGNFSAGAITATSVSGDGSGLVWLNASQLITGTVSDARLSLNVPLRNGANVFTGSNTFNGVVMATHTNNQFGGTFAGNGAGLTNLPAGQLTGTISPNNIGAGSITRNMLAAGAVGSVQLVAGAVTTTALADGAVTADKLATVTVPVSMTVLTNPTPAFGDQFGYSVAAFGNDRVIVGTPYDDTDITDAGAAYLVGANGSLLMTFTNPAPADSDRFGLSVAAVGVNFVLIGAQYDDMGAEDAGAAYLFNYTGALVTTYTNPTPAATDQFGYSVAALGNDRVLIGAAYDDTGATDAGAAYLFSFGGGLLTTFTNPYPAALDFFGLAVAALGNDRVLVGAPTADAGATDAGVVYLFRTNGTLLMTFTNPYPAASEWFSRSIAAVGNDRVLIGTPYDNAGAFNAGAAYLFSTNGTLLTAFTNPSPANGDLFGFSIAAAGNDRVLISAFDDDTIATNAGAVYLFSTNGTLLTTFAPQAMADDLFGISVAAAGRDRVFMGAAGSDIGATDAGAVHFFNLETLAPGVVAESVHVGGVTSESIAPAAVASEQIAAGAVNVHHLASAAVTTGMLVITNPAPGAFDLFGSSMTAVGDDRLLIGAYRDDTGAQDSGAAYLLTTNGTLLTTFTNPAPGTFNFFGFSVAALGNDRVIIGAIRNDMGATDSGAAYLFSTSGALLTTFTNPTPAVGDEFGFVLAAVEPDRVLIGAPNDDTGGHSSGAAYLFSTNGILLTAFTNPIPASNGQLGSSLAAVGNDRVIFGAQYDDTDLRDAGRAYLFTLDGTLLRTFTDPTPTVNGLFGYPVVAIGSDRVLIGASFDDTGGANGGKAYLFNVDGRLLATFTNPTPVNGDGFGGTLAAVGDDHVLIGAYQDTTRGPGAGAAYLFSANGTLLTTFTSPAADATIDFFGLAVAALGNNRVLIGADQDDTGASGTGAAFLYTLEFFTPGLAADTVRSSSVTTASLEEGAVTATKVADGAITTGKLADGAVTSEKLDPAIGVWSRSGNNVFRPSGNVGIGATSPQAGLHVFGTAPHLRLHEPGRGNYWDIYTEFHGNPAVSGNLLFFPGPGGVYGYIRKSDGNYFTSSDARLKKDITNLGGVLDRVLQLRPVSYRFKSAAESTPRTIGLIAQDVERLFPEAVDEHNGMKSLAYSELVPVTVGAIQELNQKLEQKLQQREREIAELKKQNSHSEKRLTDLEQLVSSLSRKLNEGGR